MDALSQLNDMDRQRMLAIMEERQMKDSFRMYNSLVERCFTDCAQDFTTKTLTGKEETCVEKCSDKFLKHSQRVGARFAEINAELQAAPRPEAGA